MTDILLCFLAGLGVTIIGWACRRRERILQFPFLAASVFLGWVFPQLLGLTKHQGLPPGSLNKTILMAILCLAAAWLGCAANRRPASLFNWSYSYDRLLRAAIGLIILGGFFFYQITLLAPEAGTQWSGPITIFVFFANMLTFGFALALILFLIKPSWPALAAVSIGLLFYLDRILIHGRRAAMAELGLLLLLSLWFNRRWQPPRLLILGSLVLGALVVNSIGDYRSIMSGDPYGWSGGGLSDILKIDFSGNLRGIVDGTADNTELTNAVMNIEAADRTFRFDYGLSLWNGIVERYVPGQWIGHDLKNAIMIRVGNDSQLVFGYTQHTGSTQTGLSDAFQSFWYLGALKFSLIGFILSRWHQAAMMGNLAGQLVVLLVMTPALHAITHSTDSFFVVFIQLAIFLLPLLWYARSRNQPFYEP